MATERCPVAGLCGLGASPHSASGMSLLQRGALPAPTAAPAAAPRPGCPLWSQRSLGLPCVGVGGPPLLLAPSMPHQPLSLMRAASSWWVSALSWGFPGSGNPALHVAVPCSAAEHACTGADHLGNLWKVFLQSNVLHYYLINLQCYLINFH